MYSAFRQTKESSEAVREYSAKNKKCGGQWEGTGC